MAAPAPDAPDGLWQRAPAWRNLIAAASFLTLAAVAVPLLLPEPPAAPTALPATDLPLGALVVPSGVLTRVNRHNRHGPGQDYPITITIVSPPAHGMVTTANGTALMPTGSGAARNSAVTEVLYQSAPGFTGRDSFTYRRISADPTDPRNAALYSITIDVR